MFTPKLGEIMNPISLYILCVNYFNMFYIDYDTFIYIYIKYFSTWGDSGVTQLVELVEAVSRNSV